MGIPLIAYSDIDNVEIEQMAYRIEDKEFEKGSIIAKEGRSVTPALYILRSGMIELSDGKATKQLVPGDVFGFGEDTLLLTNEIKQQNIGYKTDGFVGLLAQAAAYFGEKTLQLNAVAAQHNVSVTEDAKVGMLSLQSMGSVLYDITRLGKRGNAEDKSINQHSLEKKRILGAGTFGMYCLCSTDCSIICIRSFAPNTSYY